MKRLISLIPAIGLLFVTHAARAQCESHNDTLENKARWIVTVMNGTTEKPSGSKSCVDCSDGSKHHGVTYVPAACGKSEGTVCVSWGLPTNDAHRGSDYLHEAMHLYLYRLGQKNKTGPSDYKNEHLTQCLASLEGAADHDENDCGAEKLKAELLRAAYSPYNSPPWYP